MESALIQRQHLPYELCYCTVLYLSQMLVFHFFIFLSVKKESKILRKFKIELHNPLTISSTTYFKNIQKMDHKNCLVLYSGHENCNIPGCEECLRLIHKIIDCHEIATDFVSDTSMK